MVNSIQEFEMRKRLQEALRSGRYFITITRFEEDTGELKHYHIWNEFPTDDIIPSLSHIATEIEGILNSGTKNHLETIAESGRHPDNDKGRGRLKEYIPRVRDRREDTVPRDLGEQPAPDQT